MPNWCENELTITGDVHKLIAFKERAESFIAGQALKFAAFVPDPFPQKPYLTDEHYDWRIANWGTKWDLLDATLEESLLEATLRCAFDTAWSPPIAWLKSVAQMYPSLDFKLDFDEPGMEFRGTAVAEDGETKETIEDY